MRLTLKRLAAMEGALSALLAGMEGEGDWPEDVAMKTVEDAHGWVCEQIRKRAARPSQSDEGTGT